ncbi:MAG: NUDIX domain-containing protein [Actinomycetota bacterium]|nr:NUDIX domain-containing protein [Actinomycetota bacterium]MDQ2957938.1 NUDIX domain-containing protein [Actinomycetota bacterium]
MTSTPAASGATPRTAGRMFLIDADDRVLLLHERRDLDTADSHWITPGGGVEQDETLAETAMREVYEETGLRIWIDVDAEPMYAEQVEFRFAGNHFDQTNHYFLVRVPAGLAVEPAGHTEFERIVALGHRWWPLAELDASDVVREPVAMVELIRRSLALG